MCKHALDNWFYILTIYLYFSGKTEAKLLDQYNRNSFVVSVYKFIHIIAKQLHNIYFSNIHSHAGDYLMKIEW